MIIKKIREKTADDKKTFVMIILRIITESCLISLEIVL